VDPHVDATYADQEGQQCGGEGDEDGQPRAPDQPGQQIAAEIVGAEPMVGGGRLPHRADDLEDAIGGDPWGEDRQEHEEGDTEQTDRRR
jgi:hypothetical protein